MNKVKRVALVTGVTGAMGSEMVKQLANSGYTLALACSDFERARALERFCAVQGVETLLLTGDINLSGICAQWVADTLTFFRRLDVLVCNIGYNSEDEWFATDNDTDFIRHTQNEMNGLTELIRNAAKPMSSAQWGRVATVSLPYGIVSEERSKLLSTALSGMTRELAKELRGLDVTVNALLPGVIDLPCFSHLDEALKGRIPLARFGQPSEVAGALNFLLSDAASYVTGQTLSVDGGLGAQVTL